MLSDMFRQEEIDLGELETGVFQLEADLKNAQTNIIKLVRYVWALRDFDYAPSAVIPLKLIEAYQDLSEETRKIIENIAS